ncbi:MAG: TatD family hydrolase [Bacteroidales bacterium]|nr:TatD family hydrolase [Bacteroidales bacterium]
MFCDIHTHNLSNENRFVIDISENYHLADSVKYFTVGIHPKTVQTVEQLNDSFQNIFLLAQKTNCVAIGECGLDKFSSIPITLQEEIFRKQIAIAQQFNKPLVIHCVRLYSEIIRIIKDTKFCNEVILHGFNANAQTTNQLLKISNICFSISELITNPQTKGYNSLELIPLQRIFTESDTRISTDFSKIISVISEKQHVDTKHVETIIEKNFERIVKNM